MKAPAEPSLAENTCPLCKQSGIENIGEQVIEDRGGLDDRRKLRLQIFLEDWIGTREQTARIRWCQCTCCGFVYYSPRPTPRMVSIKYQRLSTKPLKQPPFPDRVEYSPEAWQRLTHHEVYTERARELFQLLSPWVSNETRILDFGGAQGAILEYFVREGMNCHVVDYGCRNPLPGIYYRAPDLQGVDEEYDLAICNHVLEHVADPIGELLSVRKALDQRGVIFVEVPLELWNRKHPKPSEPVTHINWFSAPSLRYCLEAAGFEVLKLHYSSFRTYTGTKGLAVRAIARKSNMARHTESHELPDRSEILLLKDIQKGKVGALMENFVSLPSDWKAT
ncbi:methyltransferase domain-containing protein [Lysobacter sp. F60174L2]|uniref:methyltransferase domain-containing protein n=1 Tax=Lysobacter sp. F60174L2 TaxID=3459295 RepID=UPI00403E103F